LQEAASLATARGLEVLQGAVSSTGQDEPRDPLVDALRKAVARRSPLHLRQDLQGCAWLVRALPELAFGPIQPLPLESLPPEQEVVLTVRAVTRFLSNVAGPAGVLLTLDNLQYSDAAALAALARLVRSAADVPLRIIGAYRDGDMAGGDGLSWLFASLAQDQLMRHATLRPLSMDDAADLLLATLLEPGRISAKWLQGVLDASGGVPFYLVAWAQELNLLRAEPADNYVPWSIRQSVRYRIDAAPPAVALVLEAIAAAGGRASYPLLVALTAQPEETLLSALDAAVRARLVDEDGQAYLFAYEVIRHVVEADLSHARRLVLRRRLTAVIPRESGSIWGGRSPGTQGRAATDAAERAYHLAVLRRHRTPSGVPKQPPPTI
jgi:hypothetical protein